MLINICFSLLAIPWWLEDSAAAGRLLTLLPYISWGPTKRQTTGLGRGTTQGRTEKSFSVPWRAFVVSVRKSFVKSIEYEYVLSMFPFILTREEMAFHIVMHCRSTIQRLWHISLMIFLLRVREQPSNRTQEIIINILAQRFCLLSVNIVFIFCKFKRARNRLDAHYRPFYHSFCQFYQ